jgi:uncharacterized protein (TIGR02246 family)
MSAIRLLACASLVSLAACGERIDVKDEEARLMQTSRDWSNVAASGDVDAMMAFWTDDALVIPPGQAALRGKEAIRAYLVRSRQAPGFRISWEPQQAQISAAGDLGYLIERTEVTVNASDGTPVTQSYRGVTIWRKQPDGSWKNVVDVTNPESAEPDQPNR